MSTWLEINRHPWPKVVARCLAGDEEAWSLLFTTVDAPFTELFCRMGHDRETARDLLENFFLKLLKDDMRILREFDPERAPFLLYLRSIAAKLSIAYGVGAAAKARSRSVTLDAVAELAGGRDPSEELEAMRRIERLEDLPLRDQEVLWLRGIGYSYAEIARVVGMTTGGVSATISRARRRLREDPGSDYRYPQPPAPAAP